MSEPATTHDPGQQGMRALPAALLAAPGNFRSDSRFSFATDPEHDLPPPQTEPEDPLAQAWAEGFAAGTEQARAEAESLAEQTAAAHEGLALSLARLDTQMAEDLRLRLRDTVVALCETAILPLTLDPEGLRLRIERAVAMLARADDERTIRLHPDDMALLAPSMLDDWHLEADPSLERGSLRVETPGGGVEDGPEQWRRAITEALHQC